MSRNIDRDKQKLLEKLNRTPIVEVACKQAGVPRSTYYRWRNDDEDFAEQCDEAIDHSADLINDLAESQLINAIKDKNLGAITFWLKHHHRRYVTRVNVEATVRQHEDELTPEQAAVVEKALRLAGLVDEEASNDG